MLLGGFGLFLASCATAQDDPVVLPSGNDIRVAGLTNAGGFVPIGYAELGVPGLAVYAGGTAIAGASQQLSLDQTETGKLVGDLRRMLGPYQGSVKTLSVDQGVADAGTAYLEVLDADGSRRSVNAYALGILKYPPGLLEAQELMDTLATRVRETGTAYRADRLRLIAVPSPEAPATLQWPREVPLPPLSGMVRKADLSGAAAKAVAAWLPDPANKWPAVLTAQGTVTVSWRYLLPDEAMVNG
jgi:hypothetical protein